MTSADRIDLNGVSLFINDNNNYALLFSNRIRIDELIITTVPNTYFAKTSGLLGSMDNNKLNDFRLPNGTVLNLDKNNDTEIFEKFGKAWQITNEQSIFTYQDGFDSANFINPSYVPKFLSDGVRFENSTLEELAKQECGSNQKCLFDACSTGQVSKKLRVQIN